MNGYSLSYQVTWLQAGLVMSNSEVLNEAGWMN